MNLRHVLWYYMFCHITSYRMFVLLLMLVCSSRVHGGSGGTYFVKPNSPSATCPSQPCYSLEYYLQNASELFTQSNVTLKFLPGIHLVDYDLPVTIKHVENFTMIGAKIWNRNIHAWEIPIPTSEIRCRGSFGFEIIFSCEVSIQNLLFTNCGAIYGQGRSFKTVLLIEEVINLSVSGIVIQNSTGYGLLGRNLLGKSIITHSVFMFNRGHQTFYGGNVLIDYTECPQGNSNSTLLIESSRFYMDIILNSKQDL